MQRQDGHLIAASLVLEYQVTTAMRQIHRHHQRLAVSPGVGRDLKGHQKFVNAF
jgi:hypothetical protein